MSKLVRRLNAAFHDDDTPISDEERAVMEETRAALPRPTVAELEEMARKLARR